MTPGTVWLRIELHALAGRADTASTQKSQAAISSFHLVGFFLRRVLLGRGGTKKAPPYGSAPAKNN